MTIKKDYLTVSTRSLDNLMVIANLLQDVQSCFGFFTPRELRLTNQKIRSRYSREGLSFLTKTLPRLGKAFDKALSGDCAIDSTGWSKPTNSKLPRFLGELFKRVFSSDGWVLPNPDASSVQSIRQVLYLFYKYKLPYEEATSKAVLDSFIEAEKEVSSYSQVLRPDSQIVEKAKSLLRKLLCNFNHREIIPRHGPGTVAQKEQRSLKYDWKCIPARVLELWPQDAYFCASLGHVCDTYDTFSNVINSEPSARVLLVPKDSRGPRLISCEPVALQWIQQGLMSSLVKLIESHPLTRGSVNFTLQEPNRQAALRGSIDGLTCTLDLKEASDRVSLHVVDMLFPSDFVEVLRSSRSLSTTLPNGENLLLQKFAPMGSALCFPILALTVWSILTAAECAKDSNILVYGDDVIVSKTKVLNAISALESFGLLVNRSKSCINGLFRESCGMDAFMGVDVTPVRFRTLWSSSRSPSHYTSWLAYANQMYRRGYRYSANYIAECLVSLYGIVPDVSVGNNSFDHLCFDNPVENHSTPRRRWNSDLQRFEHLVYVVEPVSIKEEKNGWHSLFRYLTDSPVTPPLPERTPLTLKQEVQTRIHMYSGRASLQASLYTLRRRSKLRKRWR